MAKPKARPTCSTPDHSSAEEQSMTLDLIAGKLDRLAWRHCIWGISEKQAWHVVRRLNEMYRQIYLEQQTRYEAMLEEARHAAKAAGVSAPIASEANSPASSGNHLDRVRDIIMTRITSSASETEPLPQPPADAKVLRARHGPEPRRSASAC